MPRAHRSALLLCGLLLACSRPVTELQAQPAQSDRARPDFPVAVPFAIDRAGSIATVEFSLPDTRENGHLRPVFIGYRSVEPKRKESEQEFRAAQRTMRYRESAPMPVRIQLETLDKNPSTRSVVLREVQDSALEGNHEYSYRTLPPGIVTVEHHPALTEDLAEMLDTGLSDHNQIYLANEFVSIVPPEPGRYRLRVESLQNHPILEGMKFELIVSHQYVKGLR